ncbi:MAG: hypothetical protein HGA35_01520 [Erysipelotrichaceae bacterium]|nr:hypothetical protein [Erysipelotrichaceae bacterium]
MTKFANSVIFTYNMPMIRENKINYDLEYLIKNNKSQYQFTPIFDSIDSTSTYIKNNLNELNNKTIIIAKLQTKGRGRYDRGGAGRDTGA